jgi:serine protease Do
MVLIDKKKRQALALTLVLAMTAAVGILPAAPALAQTRTLPDFTDLVEQVGPSVVNIRTVEKVAARSGAGGTDEEMLEFFKRFGLPMPNVPRQTPRPNRPQPQEEEQPRGVGSGFILSEVHCRRCEGGYFDHELRLWSPDGALLATSEQVAAFRD